MTSVDFGETYAPTGVDNFVFAELAGSTNTGHRCLGATMGTRMRLLIPDAVRVQYGGKYTKIPIRQLRSPIVRMVASFPQPWWTSGCLTFLHSFFDCTGVRDSTGTTYDGFPFP